MAIIDCWRWPASIFAYARACVSKSPALLLVAALCAAIPLPVRAVEQAASPAAETEASALKRVEDYLNSITSMQSRFLQVSSSGGLAEGELYVLRPGRMRIDYEPPVPVEIVADGTFLIYHDTELEQVSHIPLGSTPASILVEDDISLNGGELTVTDVGSTADALRVTLVRTENPAEGSLTLVFDREPLRLRMWRVTDAQGVVTDVSLLDARFNVPLDEDMFVFRDPRIFQDR